MFAASGLRTSRVINHFFSHHNGGLASTQVPRLRPVGTTASHHNSGIVDMYEGQLMKKILRLKLFSIASTGSYLIGYSYATINQGFDATTGAIGLLSVPFTLSPLAIGWLFRRYVLALKYDVHRDLYILQTYGYLLSKQEISFKANEVGLADVKKIASTFEVRGRPFYLNDEDLKSAEAVKLYKRMLGLHSQQEIKM